MNESEALVDGKLDELAGTHFDQPADGLAALAEATGLVNAALAESEQSDVILGVQQPEQLTVTGAILGTDTRERLRRWIEKLKKIAEAIATQFKALSYSISVSIPGGVSVGVTWATS